jgi:aminoglycoside phosphotransferase (APT) family kinase protein
VGDRLTNERRQTYERFLDAAPRLFERHQTHRNMTIGYGDAHVWNVFLPKDGGDGVRLFDWEEWRIGIASSDLAYMMSTHWYPDRRRELEKPLLDHYHLAMEAYGVRGYSRADLDDGYRLSALIQIIVPVAQVSFDIPPFVWWSHFERVMLTFDDLGCRELLW